MKKTIEENWQEQNTLEEKMDFWDEVVDFFKTFASLWIFMGWLVAMTVFGGIIRYTENKKLEERLSKFENVVYPDMGVEPVRTPTKVLKFRAGESECLSREEFFEGLEDAEMAGMADDPSVQDIYDAFDK